MNNGSKNKSYVIIPDAIIINQEAILKYNQSIELQLYSLVIHNDKNLESGHYITYLKPDSNDQWYLFNNSYVTQVGVTLDFFNVKLLKGMHLLYFIKE